MRSLHAALAGLVLFTALSACATRGTIRRMGARRHPTLATVTTPTPQPSPEIRTTLPPASQAGGLTRSVKVAKGESLWRISRRELGQGSLFLQLARVNGIQDPYILQPGQLLSVGRPGPQAPPPPIPAPPKPGPRPTAVPPGEAKRYGWVKAPNRAFTLGEKLTFAVQYGSITAGYATMSIPEVLAESGRPVYHIVATARTHPFFEKIFKVEDRIESYLDVDYQFPWRYEKHLHEGGHIADAQYVYDQRAGVMREPTKGKDEPMPIGSQDVLSCFYYFRNMDMTVGSEHTILVSADDMKSYELKVNVLRKERVQSLAGEFDCVVVQPHLKFQGVFQQKGEVFIWITDDERRIPVKVRSKIAIGSININLQDAEWVESAP